MRIANLTRAVSIAAASLWLLTACGKHQSPAFGDELKQIGSSLAIYASANNDAFPPDMGPLVQPYATSRHVPTKDALQALAGSDVAVPQAIIDGTPGQQGQWLKENSDFEYLGAGLKYLLVHSPNTTPLAIQHPDRLPSEPQLWVLYHDGHVELRPRAEVEKMAAAK